MRAGVDKALAAWLLVEGGVRRSGKFGHVSLLIRRIGYGQFLLLADVSLDLPLRVWLRSRSLLLPVHLISRLTARRHDQFVFSFYVIQGGGSVTRLIFCVRLMAIVRLPRRLAVVVDSLPAS